ncbi:hypothetical protein QBC34DRAFT_470208 [Podospora aff. communis PSN243]|uniref:Uncharacterized protein n=1 Tax=Podospora aff. communis PSN243 TaxID=3040156 RepID=A0AAV9GGL6_9PEZI|nr:hypothetical protein QBC34DRAFT_470208 [Podospora aff. communis PSN243]
MSPAPSPSTIQPELPRSAPTTPHPTPLPDIPICAVLLLLFLSAIPLHLHRPKTTPSPRTVPLPARLLLIFTLLRTTALALRIATAARPASSGLAIASSAFTSAGVAILLVLNLVLTRRWLRDYSRFGHGVHLLRLFRFLVFCVISCLVMVVSASVDRFFLRDEGNLRSARDVVRAGMCILLGLAGVPVAGVGVGMVPGVREGEKMREDGRRGWVRMGALVGTAVLLMVEVGFRTGVEFQTAEGWWNGRAALYCFVFGVEVVVVWVYGVVRVLGVEM